MAHMRRFQNLSTQHATARKNDLGVLRLKYFGVSFFTIIDSLLSQSANKLPIILLHSANSFKTLTLTALDRSCRLFLKLK